MLVHFKSIRFFTYLFCVFGLLFGFSCRAKKAIVNTQTLGVKADSKIKSKYAEILGVPLNNLTNDSLYSFINEWYGIPYKYGGKDKNGIDCSGFTSVLYQKVYSKKISPATSYLLKETKQIEQTDLQEGDLVFFKISNDKISHVGVYLQNQKFVHASTKKGIIINSLEEPYYKKYFVRSGRVK